MFGKEAIQSFRIFPIKLINSVISRKLCNNQKCYIHTHTSLKEQTKINTLAKKTKQEKKKIPTLASDEFFERFSDGEKNKENFYATVDMFKSTNVRYQIRGHINFIYAALKNIEKFGAEQDKTVYNKLLDLMPKGPYIPKNRVQALFYHQWDKQMCAVKVLQKMEDYGVIPDDETKEILIGVFGRESDPVTKMRRMLYWQTKFRYANPFPVPKILPADPIEMASLALCRVADDKMAKFTVYNPEINMEELNISKTSNTQKFIASIQSQDQRDVLCHVDKSAPLFIEGAFNLWLRGSQAHYYILRGEQWPKIDEKRGEEIPEWMKLKQLDSGRFSYDQEEELPSEQPIYAMCVVSDTTPIMFQNWLLQLQKDSPILAKVPVFFSLDKHLKSLHGN